MSEKKDFCLLFCFLDYPGWIDLAAKNERLFTCSCACVYICCCEWDMFVWLTLFWHWWWQIGQIFVVMLMMMIGWSNLFIIIDDDWMTIIAATWKRKRKFFCTSSLLKCHAGFVLLLVDRGPFWFCQPNTIVVFDHG